MAFNEFYMRTGGSNFNSGSTNADSATVAETTGTWVQSTRTFTASSGTPFSGVSAGDWASFYLNTDTVGARHIAKVTSVGGGGASITVSSTTGDFYGAAPADANVNRARVGGAFGGLLLFASGTGAFNGITVGTSTRINIRAGTYSSATTSLTVTTAGSNANQLVFRGYNSTPGDLDTAPTATRTPGTDMPLFSWTTGTPGMSGSYQQWHNVAFAQGANAQTLANGNYQTFLRCRFEATAANVSARAIGTSGSSHRYLACSFIATNTADHAAYHGGSTDIADCYYRGGATSALRHHASGSIVRCIIDDPAGDGITVTNSGASVVAIDSCTIYSAGGDGIEVSGALSVIIRNCIISESGGWGINASTSTGNILIDRNVFWSNTSGTTTGTTDNLVLNSIASAASPLTNPASDDFTPTSSALDPLGGAVQEGLSLRSYRSAGAIQAQASAAAGGGVSRGRVVNAGGV